MDVSVPSSIEITPSAKKLCIIRLMGLGCQLEKLHLLLSIETNIVSSLTTSSKISKPAVVKQFLMVNLKVDILIKTNNL